MNIQSLLIRGSLLIEGRMSNRNCPEYAIGSIVYRRRKSGRYVPITGDEPKRAARFVIERIFLHPPSRKKSDPIKELRYVPANAKGAYYSHICQII